MNNIEYAASLIEKQRASRLVVVEVGGRNFTIRRPTYNDSLSFEGITQMEVFNRFVTDYDLLESDIIPGGGPERVPFDSVLFAEWVADKPEVWGPITSAVIDSYAAHLKRKTEAVKN